MLWEVLVKANESMIAPIVVNRRATYLACIADLEEAGSSVEHYSLLAWGSWEGHAVVGGGGGKGGTNGDVRHDGELWKSSAAKILFNALFSKAKAIGGASGAEVEELGLELMSVSRVTTVAWASSSLFT